MNIEIDQISFMTDLQQNKHLNYTWNVTEYHERGFTVQLYFADPEEISKGT